MLSPPERSEQLGADSAQLFDPGIQRRPSLPLEPPPPPPLLKAVSDTHKGPSPQVNKPVRPNVPPKPVSVMPQGTQGVSSEMESDDYHHISEQLNRAANKINKTRLALDLQDRECQPSRLSESDEDNKLRPVQAYAYDDGEVALKKVMSPQSLSIEDDVTRDLSLSPSGSAEGVNSPSVGEYLIPKHPMVKPLMTRRVPPKESDGETQLKVESELERWLVSEIGRDGRYYGYKKGNHKEGELIENAIVYHFPAHTFVQVTGKEIRKVARMPITMDQLLIFNKFSCYTCFDAIREPPDNKEDLLWDSFQIVYAETDPTYETPYQVNRYPTLEKGQESYKLNSFGNLADLTRHPENFKEMDVEHLLDVRTHL